MLRGRDSIVAITFARHWEGVLDDDGVLRPHTGVPEQQTHHLDGFARIAFATFGDPANRMLQPMVQGSGLDGHKRARSTLKLYLN